MPIDRILPALVVSSLVLLQACASSSPQEQEPLPGEPDGELVLNLPDPENCSCAESPVSGGAGSDYTFLDKGLSALAAGEYIDAVEYFQRYKRVEDNPVSDWEAGVAIAYVSMLAQSPFHDPESARKSYRRLKSEYGGDMQVHEKTLMMRAALETFLGMDRKLDELEELNARLKEELGKREDALKRLRELTLGQKAE